MERKDLMIRVNKVMKKAIAFSLVMVMALAGMAALGSRRVDAATDPKLSTGLNAWENADGTITARFMALGNLEMFDLGLVYDKTKVKVIDYGFEDNFINNYKGIYTSHDFGNYVVFGGTSGKYTYYLGMVGYVTFSVLGDDPGSIMLVHDSTGYNGDFTDAGHASSTVRMDLNDRVVLD